MGLTGLIIASVALSGIQMMAQNAALDDQAEAAREQANAEIEELDRQRHEEAKVAQEKKADRVRQADKEVASLVVAMADRGGAGGTNEDRLVGEVGGYEGLDLARIEGNKHRKIESLHASQIAARNRALNIGDTISGKKTANFLGFLGGAAAAGVVHAKASAAAEAAKQGT